ncbi:MAG: Type 1 glutamine amidotransferase-like domain-containing protein [Frankiales bacterium]|nr:Type 1 glutamine amidotransferase-like domain-containing protein [Frankiales bacterium]
MSPGPLALVGSGEYLPVMLEVEAQLLAGRPARYVQLPTAAAPEGTASLARWVAPGQAQAARLGVEAVPVLVKDREDADNAALAALVEGAGLIYLSGGNPPYCSATLRGSLVWRAIEHAWRGGAALAGCSAGAMALTSWVPDIRHPLRDADGGLGIVPGLRVIPHFDRFSAWLPDLVTRYLTPSADVVTVVGIDEDTALVWDDGRWVVQGRQSVWLLTPDGRSGHGPGEVLDLPGPI